MKRIVQNIFKLLGYQVASNKAVNAQLNFNNNLLKLSKKYYDFYLSYNLKLNKLTDSEYLQYLEKKYGGYITDVPTTIKSDGENRIYVYNHTGGDRMNVFLHNYSEKYSNYLKDLRSSKRTILLLEVGILKGTGLAIWDEYFENKKIYGFDYDLGNIEQNMNNLLALGAFGLGLPTLKFFDQFADNKKVLKETFGNQKLDVVIDDAYHSDESIINTFNELQPYLGNEFVYFIEDNSTAWRKLKALYPNYVFDYDYNQLTIITNMSEEADKEF